ncbi:MAG: SH3 domain-containing protein [Sarcina sp.]
MKKKNLLGMLLLASALTFSISTSAKTNPNIKTENHILLTKPAHEQNINSKNNENLSKSEVQNLKGKTIQKDGMTFSGIKAMKIAPDMTNSFAVTPGFDSNGFASSVNKNLYNYELNMHNDKNSMAEAINLNGGNPVNTCVFFQSSSLRAIGQNVPDSIGYTAYLENWLANNGWTKHTNFNYIQKGDLCFASYYHTFLFMGWKNKAKGIAWVMGNESFVQPYYRPRNLNGQSPQIYGENSYTGATVYWTYGQGYQGPQNTSNPLHKSVYNAFGSTQLTTSTPLYQNEGGNGAIYATIPSGTTLPILESQNGWYKVYFESNFGWINANAGNGIAESLGGSGGVANTLTGSNIGGPYKNIQSTQYPSIGTGVIIANGLYLHENASLNSPNIGILPQGANISVIAQNNNMYEVQYYGQVGWVSSNPNYIQTMMSPSTPSPAAQAPNHQIKGTSVNGTTTVNVDLYLNNEPTSTQNGATSLTTIPAGTTVNVLENLSNGWYKVQYNGVTGYIDASYTNGITPNYKWIENNGVWYYINKNGQKQTGWIQNNNTWYYLNNNGQMQTGWIKLNGQWYYLNSYGAMQTGWFEQNDHWYFANSNGQMQTGWIQDNNTWYYLNNNGQMQTGWIKEGYLWYYANSSGAMQTGCFEQNDHWYFLNSIGQLQTTWILNNGNWYYANKNGEMQTGWVYYKNQWYYLNSYGQMQTGTVTINNTVYTFNNNGVLIN